MPAVCSHPLAPHFLLCQAALLRYRSRDGCKVEVQIRSTFPVSLSNIFTPERPFGPIDQTFILDTAEATECT